MLACWIHECFQVNVRRSCRLAGFSKSGWYKGSQARDQSALRLRIREIAQENRVPILDAPPLARALYRHTEIGQDIPSALYEAVALVMAYVFQLRRFNTQGGAYPVAPTQLPVPGTLDPGAETPA